MVGVDARPTVGNRELDYPSGRVGREVHGYGGRRGSPVERIPTSRVDGVIDEIADNRDELRSEQGGCPERVIHSKPQLHAALSRLRHLAEKQCGERWLGRGADQFVSKRLAGLRLLRNQLYRLPGATELQQRHHGMQLICIFVGL